MTRQTDTLDPVAAGNAARAALAATSTRDLMTKAYALTHRMDRAKADGRKRDVADVRAMRDAIEAEVLRRTGGQ